MKFRTILLSFMLFLTAISLQAQNDTDTDFTLKTEIRDSAPFNKIYINGRFNVSITQSEKQEVKVSAPEKLQRNVGTEIINGTLTISIIDLNQNKNILESIKDKWSDYLIRKPIEISISVANLQAIDSKGAPSIDILGLLDTKELNINLSGASKAILNTKIDEKLQISMEEASKIDIKGGVEKLILTCNGAAVFNGNDLATKDATVHLIGASRATVLVSESIDANLSGVTKLVCNGSPKQVKQNVSRGSSLIIQ